jgi:predicted RNA binding protein YcfA (HicA-like mRNA interferase family)
MRLPQVTPKQLVRILEKRGFRIVRQAGSHARLHDHHGNKVTIAMHNTALAKGTLLSILKQANLTKEDLLEEI